MRRWAIPILAVTTILAGCGGGARTTVVTAPAPSLSLAARCASGVMGCATLPAKPGTAAPRATFGALIPDVSEYQACGLHSEAIYRVYEAGTGREDSTARCHAEELRRLHAWAGTYAFLRPGSCTAQADRVAAIVRSLGGADVVVADAEVPLPRGFVRCWLARVHSHGDNVAEYTCPGCGDEQVGPVWIAAYPFRPAGRWIAHQFSDNFNCRGVVGDCSVNEGILSIRRSHPTSRKVLLARRDSIRRYLASHGCRHRAAHHEHIGPRCRAAFRAGNRVNAELAGR